MDLSNKTVLITGASGGLGRVVAQSLAQTGARLALTARRMGDLQALGEALGLSDERLLLIPADLANPAEVAALIEAIAARWGGVDILLNLAGGWGGGADLADTAVEDWERVLQSNLQTAFLINRAVLPYMVKQGWGRIVNIASRAAVEPRARQAAYNVAKAGVVALTASIAAEYRRKGVAANVILPSIIDSAENRAQMGEADRSRWVNPEQLAALLLFLCSPAGGELNGASIPVYGRV